MSLVGKWESGKLLGTKLLRDDLVLSNYCVTFASRFINIRLNQD